MGLFDLFSGFNDMERQLLKTYFQLMAISGFPISKRETKDMMKAAIAKSKKDGTYYLPPNMGDIILGYAKNDALIVSMLIERINRNLPNIRAEGVTDKDIRCWWNLHDLERRMIEKTELRMWTYKYLVYINQYKHLPYEDAVYKAGLEMRKKFPYFGDKVEGYDSQILCEEDRPLPYELKERVDNYLRKWAKDDPVTFEFKILPSPSLNAFLRKEIQEGNL